MYLELQGSWDPINSKGYETAFSGNVRRQNFKSFLDASEVTLVESSGTD